MSYLCHWFIALVLGVEFSHAVRADSVSEFRLGAGYRFDEGQKVLLNVCEEALNYCIHITLDAVLQCGCFKFGFYFTEVSNVGADSPRKVSLRKIRDALCFSPASHWASTTECATTYPSSWATVRPAVSLRARIRLQITSLTRLENELQSRRRQLLR